MALRDPVAIYNAANNIEAHVVRAALVNEGIEAHVTEDLSQVGTWMFGLLPEIHKPQVWVDRANVEQARPILVEYDQARAVQGGAVTPPALDAPPIEVVCEDCGERTFFAPETRGSIQPCPRCGEYVDVEDAPFTEEWREAEKDEGTGAV